MKRSSTLRTARWSRQRERQILRRAQQERLLRAYRVAHLFF
jgi:hypothetical protein